MKVTLTENPPERELVAVIGSGGTGIFLPVQGGGVQYVDHWGRAKETRQQYDKTLEEVLKRNLSRKPVYKGDEITLKF